MADILVKDIFKEIIELRSALSEETDRGVALMAGSYLDETLARLFKSRFLEEKKLVKEVFSPTGSLGTFSARIDLAYLIGFIGKNTYRDLHLIRKIRNEFGHTSQRINFESQSIKDKCKELRSDGLKGNVNLRAKFSRCVLGITGHLHSLILRSERIQPYKETEIHKYLETFETIQSIILGEGYNIDDPGFLKDTDKKVFDEWLEKVYSRLETLVQEVDPSILHERNLSNSDIKE